MAKIKLRQVRPRKKALFGEAAATVTAAGIQAAATAAAAALQAKATRDGAKQQSQQITQAASRQAQAIKDQNDVNRENTERMLDTYREQMEESRAQSHDDQLELRRAMGNQIEDDRLQQSRIPVKNGKRVTQGLKGIKQSFLQGGYNMPFRVTDGGGVIPIGQTPEGYDLYEVIGDDHEHYHKTKSGKYKSGVGFKFANGSIVEGEGNQNSTTGEYLMTTPNDAIFISKHNIHGFNPVQAINNGMSPILAANAQETIKDITGISDDGKNNASSPVKKNGGISAATNNILQPYIIGDIAMRRTLKNGGRPQAGIGDYIRSGLDWLLRDNQVAQYINNSAPGRFLDNAWYSYNNWANGLINDIGEAISTAHISPSFGWYGSGSTPTKEEGLGSTPTKEDIERAFKATENYYSDLIKETKQDIKSGRFFRESRHIDRLFSDIYGATGINLGSEYGLLGSMTPGGSMAVAGAILRGGNPLTRRAMAEAIGAREAQAEMRNAMNTYGVRSGATTKFGVPAAEVDPLAEQLATDRAFANQYATTTNNVMANAMRKAQQKVATNTAEQKAAADRAFDKYLKDNPQAALDIWAANERARIFTPTVNVNGGRNIPGALQFTDDLGLNAFGVPYPLNDYGARMMQIENGVRSQLAAMPTTSQLIGYMRNGAAQRSMMPRSLRTAGQRIGNALDNAYWWGRYLPARTAEKARNLRAARNAKASLNDPALDNWANGIISRWRPAGQKATQATENAVQANWFRRHPYITTGLGITGLGIGGTLGYNLASYNPETDGPINMGDLESSYNVTDSMRRASRQQRAVTNAATNDFTNTSTPAASTSVRTDSTTTNSAPAVSAPTDSTSTKKAQTKSSKTVSDAQASSDAAANGEDKKFKNFNEAFDYYHEKYGDDGTFVFGGLKYGTKKEKDAKKEARNRRWGARRTEDSLATILGDITELNDVDRWNKYLSRSNRYQTRNGGRLSRIKAADGNKTSWLTLPRANVIGAGINSLGTIGGALTNYFANNAANSYLQKAYGQAGEILADAWNSRTGIDASYLNNSDFRAAHYMPAVQAVMSHVSAPLALENRSLQRTLSNAGRYSASGAAAFDRMNLAEVNSRDARSRIYEADEEQKDKTRNANQNAYNEAARFDAQADNTSRQSKMRYDFNILTYNNDIANDNRMGAAQSRADALIQQASSAASTAQSNGNLWNAALGSLGTTWANAFSSIGKFNSDTDNIMAGTDPGARINTAVGRLNNSDKNYLRSVYVNLNPKYSVDADYMKQIETAMPEVIGTNKFRNLASS